jgi:hypothetical protein
MTMTGVSFDAPVIPDAYDCIIQSITTSQPIGNAVAAALGNPGDALTFNDDNALRLAKNGQPAWAAEVVVTQAKRDIADQFAAGVNPPALGLPGQAFAAARAAMTVRTGGREIQYSLREWAESLGYEVQE